jgi:hypothetical protein
MRAVLASLAALTLGCGGSGSNHSGDLPDAPPAPGIDAPPACQPTPLLVGGTDVTQQGWTVTQSQPDTLSNGADFVQLATTTVTAPSGAKTGGQLLLSLTKPAAFTPPFRLAITMAILRVDNHNQLDAAAAILPSYSGSFGNGTDRSQMIYIDNTKVGFAADDPKLPPVTASLVGGAFHDFVVAVDAANTLTLTVDGQLLLTHPSIALDGTIAIGDQTNDPNFDSSIQIRSVALLCP